MSGFQFPAVAVMITLAIICFSMCACVHPNLVEPGSPRQGEVETSVVRAYFSAINAKNQAALANLLAENVQVMAGHNSWGKATELTNRVEWWTRDPTYSVEIKSIALQGGVVRVRVMVTYVSHGSIGRQEIENTFKVQNRQIVQAILSP